MATLPTLYGASPIDSDNGTYHTFTIDTAQSANYDLDNTPADFINMLTLGWRVNYSLTGALDGAKPDTYGLYIGIYTSGGTMLAGQSSPSTNATINAAVTNTTDVNTPTSGTTAFNYVNTTATKTDWDGAVITIQQTYTKDAGPDGVAIRVDQVVIEGTYNAASDDHKFMVFFDNL